MSYTRTEDELFTAWGNQVRALNSSCLAFDAGEIWEASRIATAVFILVGRTKGRHVSICDAAGNQENRQYWSTVREEGQLGLPLVLSRATVIREGEVFVEVAPLGKSAVGEGRLLPFDRWWNELVVTSEGHRLSRGEIVRVLRDKEGGAHFDPVIDDKLTAAALRGEIGFYFHRTSGAEREPVGFVLENCMRQIGSELLKSFRDPREWGGELDLASSAESPSHA